MTLTTHAAIGAVIGTLVGNPVLGFCLGAASHFLVDMIPHGDSKMSDNFRLVEVKNKKKTATAVAYVSVDAGVAVVLLMLLGTLLSESITDTGYAAAVIGSVIPDVLVGLSDIYKNKYTKAYAKFHFFFHDFFVKRHGDVKLPYSLAVQALSILVLVHYIVR